MLFNFNKWMLIFSYIMQFRFQMIKKKPFVFIKQNTHLLCTLKSNLLLFLSFSTGNGKTHPRRGDAVPEEGQQGAG